MSPAAILSIVVRANTAEANAALMRTEAQMRSTAAAGNAMGARVAAATRVLSVGTLAVGVIAGKMAMDFQKNMTLVQTQAGATSGEVKRLSGQVLELSRHSQFNPDQLAQGLFRVESHGYHGAQAMKVLNEAQKLAAVGQADLEQTAFALSAALNSNIRGTHNLAKATGTMNAIVGLGSMRMDEMVGALNTGLLPAGANFGLSLRQVGAGLDVMTRAGMPAQLAATRLRMTFSLLAAQSDRAQKALGPIGLAGNQLARDMRKSPDGLITAIQDLHDHLGQVNKVQQSQILSEAFGGGRSSSAIMTLVEHVGELRDLYGQINDKAMEFPADYWTTQQTQAFQLKEAWNSIQADLIQVGQDLAPIIADIAQGTASAIHLFTELPSSMQATVAEAGLMAYPIIKVVSWVNKLRDAWAALGVVEETTAGGEAAAMTEAAGAADEQVIALGAINRELQAAVGFGTLYAEAMTEAAAASSAGVAGGGPAMAEALGGGAAGATAARGGATKAAGIGIGEEAAVAGGSAASVGALSKLGIIARGAGRWVLPVTIAFTALDTVNALNRIKEINKAASGQDINTRLDARIKQQTQDSPVNLPHTVKLPVVGDLSKDFQDALNMPLNMVGIGGGDQRRKGMMEDLKGQLTAITEQHKHINLAEEQHIRHLAVELTKTGDLTKEQRHQIDTVASASSGKKADIFGGTKQGSDFSHFLSDNWKEIMKNQKFFGHNFQESIQHTAEGSVNTLKMMAPGMRQAGAKAMIVTAQALADKGKLPEAEVQQMIKDINKKWPDMIVPGVAAAKTLKNKVSVQLAGFDTNTPAKKFDAMTGKIKAAMNSSQITVKQGTSLINQVLQQEFAALGIPNLFQTQSQSAVTHHGDTTDHSGRKATKGAMHGAVVPGNGSGDTVPLHIGGHLAAFVEPGELVSVNNRTSTAALMAHNAEVPRRAQGGTIPTWSGSGAFGAMAAGALDLEGNAARQVLKHLAKTTGSAGSPGPSGGPSGTINYMGITMAKWVAQALQYAAQHGSGNPQPTSGYRSHATNVAAGRTYHSEHENTKYPGGAVDFGGMVDPPSLPKKMAVVNASRSYDFPLLAPQGFRDDGHASGTGHMHGGIIQRLNKGGYVFPPNSEGPRWYDKAYDLYGQWGTGDYFTHLHKPQEDAFEQWLHKGHVKFNPAASISDYDMRGYWAAGGRNTRGHYPDTFKTPWDTRFSRESKYAKPGTPYDWRKGILTDLRTGQHITRQNGGLVQGFKDGGWIRVGATYEGLDGHQGAYGKVGGMGFAELLVAGANAGMWHQDLAASLGLSNKQGVGMPPHTRLHFKVPGGKKEATATKNDIGSGQAGNPHYKVDVQTGLMHAIGWNTGKDLLVSVGGGAGGPTNSASLGHHGKGKNLTQAQANDLGIPDFLYQRVLTVQNNIKAAGDMADRSEQLGAPLNGKSEQEWLQEELGYLLQLRNLLIQVYTNVFKAKSKHEKQLQKITNEIKNMEKNKPTAPAHQNAPAGSGHGAHNAANAANSAATDKYHKDLKSYENKLRKLKKEQSHLQDVTGSSGVDSATGATQAVKDLLDQTQGTQFGTDDPIGMKILQSLPPVGVLGGDIFTVQMKIADLTGNKADATATDSETSSLLATMLAQARAQLAVSNAQYPIISQLPQMIAGASGNPFLGGFATGGVTPRDGIIRVGETGEELLKVPGGSHITPSHQNRGSKVHVTLEDNRTTIHVDGEMVREIFHDEMSDSVSKARRRRSG